MNKTDVVLGMIVGAVLSALVNWIMAVMLGTSVAIAIGSAALAACIVMFIGVVLPRKMKP